VFSTGHNTLRALCAGVLLFSAVSVRATTVLVPKFEAMVQRADLIFTGQVVSQASEWRQFGGRNTIVTLVTFTVEATHKGQGTNRVVLQFLGGKVGDVALEVPDMPSFKTGERVLLFVSGNGVVASPVFGFYHGRFGLQKDTNGRDWILRHDGKPLLATSNTKSSGGNGASLPVAHEDLVRAIERHLPRKQR
jgi:hypothetical protein